MREPAESEQLRSAISHFELEDVVREYVEISSASQSEVQCDALRQIVKAENPVVLEIGCGPSLSCDYSESLDSPTAIGVDISIQMLRALMARFPDALAIRANAVRLPLADGTVDLVVAKNLIHHLVGKSRKASRRLLERFLGEVSRVAKRDAIIVIREWCARNRLLSSVMFYTTYLCSRLGVEIKYLDIHDGVVVHFYTKEELIEEFRKFGFTVLREISWEWVFRGVRLGEGVVFLLRRACVD